MASALVPSGINKTIKPVLQVPNIKEYQFIVYDRWGKKIFETSTLTAGWDGTNKGEALPFGSYTYMVKVVSQNGTDLVKKGTIVLVR
jgi:gliding motility-associated-like protein